MVFYVRSLILQDFLQRTTMRIKATGVFREKSGISNFTQNGMERQIPKLGESTRVLQKWRF